MELIGHFLPSYQFAEEHSLYVPASPAAVLDAASRPDVVDDPIARRLIALRELPTRLMGRLGFESTLAGRSAFGAGDFTLLGRDGDRELAYGLAGRFWRSDYGLVPLIDAQDFVALNASGLAKLVLNFYAQVEGSGTRVTTHTRVCCGDASAYRRFRAYWFLIRPASGLIRRRLLMRVREAALLAP
ncbi:hypothetical protein SNE35_26585 [Paucibacter sp. R3-3]|uniref:DUF2867 domain-containing protein n=1 Tax=Roseateles agri TaxID=3098619 RepID=A0ABU5DQW0_9BURK|nr:hypothetical protein [Paucibacter sp. R3-3]MDY0748096.1 hypothetical protein [Paucibacter sp. R3-3]